MVRPMWTPPEARLGETLKALDRTNREANRPTGTEKNRTLEQLSRSIDYLSTLQAYATNGASWNTGTIPNDQVVRWDDATTVQISGIDVPWQKMLVSASVGEASIAPSSGGYAEAFVAFWVLDAAGNVTADNRSYYAGRLYSGVRMGMSISTGQRLVTVDASTYPGPYTVRMQFGHWATITGTGAASIQFNSPSLTVQIIGDGVPD